MDDYVCSNCGKGDCACWELETGKYVHELAGGQDRLDAARKRVYGLSFGMEE